PLDSPGFANVAAAIQVAVPAARGLDVPSAPDSMHFALAAEPLAVEHDDLASHLPRHLAARPAITPIVPIILDSQFAALQVVLVMKLGALQALASCLSTHSIAAVAIAVFPSNSNTALVHHLAALVAARAAAVAQHFLTFSDLTLR